MRASVVLILVLFAGAANAQQCAQCAAADACIKEYTRAVTKIRADYRKGAAAQLKGREQSLRNRFSPRSAIADRDSLAGMIRDEIGSLKDCLGKIQ